MHQPISFWLRFLFWKLNVPFVGLVVRRRFNFLIEKGSDRLPPPPYLVVANHATFFDPWMVGYQSFWPLSIMMNDDGFRGSSFTGWYLRSIGAFPKKKGAHDFKAMKTTIARLRSNIPVLIFPEGQTTWDGETQPIYRGIEKILKKTGASLVMMRLRGNFLCRPWWAHHYRKGRVAIRISVCTPQQIAAMSDDEVLDTIRRGIYNNDIKEPDNQTAGFRGTRCAEGLENFVWMCRRCSAEDTLVTAGETIRCSACGHEMAIDALCRLRCTDGTPPPSADLKDWTQWHKEQVRQRLAGATPKALITASDNVLLRTENEQGTFVDRMRGRLELTKLELRFTPQEAGEPLVFSLTMLADCVFQRRDIFEFLYEKKYYRFVLHAHSPMKWLFYLRYMSGYAAFEERGII